jgi:hypothetical protein
MAKIETRRTRRILSVGALVMVVAGCGSGSATVVQDARTTTTLSASDTAVISAWTNAEETIYRYQQEPVGPERADLVSGESTSALWPSLAEDFTGSALQTTTEFLVKTTMAALNGPTSYDLGHPRVTALTSSTATVASCITDSGTTTASGQPAPADLAGGAGSYAGSWGLLLVGDSWKVGSFQTTTVHSC